MPEKMQVPSMDDVDNSTKENSHVPKNAEMLTEYLSVNIDCLNNLINPTELLIKGHGIGMKLLSSPELKFSCLIKLKTLSLINIKSFPENIFTVLRTVVTDLNKLEIGSCEGIPDDFPEFLKKLSNLRSLRLENCYGSWNKCSKENFDAIRSLKKLKKLELINIEFSDCVAQELAKCVGIKVLLIIPIYDSHCAITIRLLLDCLEKLSKTLTHVVWGLTIEILHETDIFLQQYKQNQHIIQLGFNVDMLETRESFNNIPILKSRKFKLKPKLKHLKTAEIDKRKSDIDLLSVSSLRDWFDLTMVNAKTKVIKVPYSKTTDVYLSVEFDDI